MAEREVEHRRIVVETPSARREVEHSEAVHYPERSGTSGAVLAAVVVGVIALAAVIILFVMNQQNTADETAATQPPQTTIVQQPPIIVEQPAPATQPAPVIVTNSGAAGGSTSPIGTDDAAIQAAVDKKLNDDPTLSSLGITATVLNGKVTLMGVVKTQTIKAHVEHAVWNVKGVKAIDNQISVG
jgi:hypothetical protein